MAQKFERGRARMFESNFFEFFSKVHPATPLVLYTPVVVACLYFAVARYSMGAALILGLLVAGYVAWTLMEYWLHRTIFHLRLPGPLGERLHFLMHGVHHDYPHDHTRLVMPPAISVTLAVLVFGLLYVVVGLELMLPFFAGIVTGYIGYDTLHWYTHAGKPKSRLLRYLRREHLIHHFKENETRYGVSCPWWDHAFGTAGERHPSSSPARGEEG